MNDNEFDERQGAGLDSIVDAAGRAPSMPERASRPGDRASIGWWRSVGSVSVVVLLVVAGIVVLSMSSTATNPQPNDALPAEQLPDGLVIEDVTGEDGDRCPIFTLDGEALVLGDTCTPANSPPNVIAVAVWPRDDSKVYSLVSLPARWSLADFEPAASDAGVWFDGRAVLVIGPAQFGPEVVPTGILALIRDDGLTASCELTLRRLECE